MKNLFFVIILLCSFSVTAQKHTETINKELKFAQASPDNMLTVSNINGSVTVEGYSGTTILLEVEKTIKGKNQRKLEQGKEEVEVGIHEEDNDILVYVKTPCTEVKSKMNEDGKWHWNTWKNNCHCESGIDFHFDIKIKVPFSSNISISTVNNGDVNIENVSGMIDANNVNGNISLQKIAGQTNVNTINGTVDITYTKNPTEDCRYHSFNGDVNIFFQKGLSAQLTFESYNGDFFTTLDDVKIKPLAVNKKKEKNKGKGIKYKIGGKSNMQIGNGKVLLDFETFNGNVYLKEIND